jgi:hypothetical protein
MKTEDIVSKLRMKRFKLEDYITREMVERAKQTANAIDPNHTYTALGQKVRALVVEEVISKILGGTMNTPIEGDSETFYWDVNLGDKKLEIKTQNALYGTDAQPIELLRGNCWHLEENERWRNLDYLLVVTLNQEDVIIPRVLVCPKTDPNFRFVDGHRHDSDGNRVRCVHYSAKFHILSER